jgi:hypothetical protein
MPTALSTFNIYKVCLLRHIIALTATTTHRTRSCTLWQPFGAGMGSPVDRIVVPPPPPSAQVSTGGGRHGRQHRPHALVPLCRVVWPQESSSVRPSSTRGDLKRDRSEMVRES